MGFIRFLLACAVVLCHTSTIMGYSPVSGNLAVQCFYIISGFYMAMVLTEKYDNPGGRGQFYINRALKIYPVYWFVLLLLFTWSIIVYHLKYPGTLDFYTKYSSPAFASYLYLVLANLLIIGLDWTFLLGIDRHGRLYFTNDFNKARPAVYNFGFNSIAWTVGVELAFYLIAPWLNKRKYYLLIILFLASLGLRLLLISRYTDRNPWNYMFFPTQVMFFIAGIFSFRLYVKFVKAKAGRPLQYVSYIIFLAVILFYYQFFDESYTKQAVLFLAVILLVPFAFEATKKSRADIFLGNLSYPIYISQMLVIKFVTAKKFPKLIDMGFTALLVTVLFALFIHFIVAAPIESYRQRRLLKFHNKTS
ncbi:acyltransferase family protein [Mucilaginibacter angelicae]|uniref:Acyltransferase family protein n=1 Tax=Mucilaginibacter angelicae TaxID=869718 RepID=A0ABV6L543_9SPHI